MIAILTNVDDCIAFEQNLTIPGILSNAMPICEMERTHGRKAVALALDIQVTKLAACINLNNNLNDFQIKILVHDLLDRYRYETLEDFVLVFKKARQGEFGPILKLDSPVVFTWMEKYLDAKYDTMDKVIKNEQDERLKEYKQPIKDIDYEKYKAKIKAEGFDTPTAKPAWANDDDYQRFKTKRYADQIREQAAQASEQTQTVETQNENEYDTRNENSPEKVC